MSKDKSPFILPESTLLITMCMIDMFYTLYLVRTGTAKEANPLLKDTLAYSDLAFLMVKGASFMVPVLILELVRPIRPKFVTTALRFTVCAYAVMYLVGIFSVHTIGRA